MSLQFLLVEDDAVTRKMLKRIIEDSELGEVVGEAEDGLDVTIHNVQGVDVVLIDLLMPGRDGIETIKHLRLNGYEGRFIMISQVENKEMVGEAYMQGIDTFIRKPVNRLEVLAVLRRVADHLALSNSLDTIRRSLMLLDQKETLPHRQETVTSEKKVRQLLLQLGIAGEAGAHDLFLIMCWISGQEQTGRPLRELPQLKELYDAVLRSATEIRTESDLQKEVRAMEQRIRRMVLNAFSNLASLGLTDFANPTFENFAPRLFDFQEVRKRMKEIENGEEQTECRINVRKFLTVFYMELKNQ